MVNRASIRQQIMKPGLKRGGRLKKKKKKDGKWIQKANIKKGALRKKLGVKKGKKITMAQLNKASKSRNPTTRKQVALARAFRNMKRRS
tara:strand:+ start:238 stop:504 length:267 start_codon:yes stop_codon:yes gene_type:complete